MTLKDFIDEIFSDHDSSDANIAGLQEAIDDEDVLGIFDGLIDVLQSIHVEATLGKIFTLIFIKTGLINSSNVFDYVGAFGLGVTLFFYSALKMKASNLVIDTRAKWEALQKTEDRVNRELFKLDVLQNEGLTEMNFKFNDLILYPRITRYSPSAKTFTIEEIFGSHGVAENLRFFYYTQGDVECNNIYLKKDMGKKQIDERNFDLTGTTVSDSDFIVKANTLNIDIVFANVVIPTWAFKVVKFTNYSVNHKLNIDYDKPTAVLAGNNIFFDTDGGDVLSEIILPKTPMGTALFIPGDFIYLPNNIVISKSKGQKLITESRAKEWLNKHVKEI